MRRDSAKTIQTLKDPVLGDPEFYEDCVKPLVEELDAAGQRLLAPASDAELDEIYRVWVPLWAEIEYEIQARRTAWLKDRFFEWYELLNL